MESKTIKQKILYSLLGLGAILTLSLAAVFIDTIAR